MRFFDAHCDAVMNAYDGPFDFVGGDARGHMDLPRLLSAGHRAQVFAIYAVTSRYQERGERKLALHAIATLNEWASGSQGQMTIAKTGADVKAAFDSAAPKLVAIIGLEGADPLGGADALPEFFDLGLRLVIPAWDDNQFSGSATGKGGPLTAEGVKLVELARNLGVVVDVSHASDAAFDQIVELMGKGPFIASHSNCRSVSPSPRNLTDEQIRTLASRGGVMGINLAPDFLAANYLATWDAIMAPAADMDPTTRRAFRREVAPQLDAIPQPPLEWVARHVRHAMNLGGEDCVGFGGDMDGITHVPAGITGVESYPLIVDTLAAAGLTERQIEKICWRNMLRVFQEILP